LTEDIKKKRKPKVKKTVKKIKPEVVNVYTSKPIITDVFSEDYSIIDETIENIKITSRKICQDQYSSNNVYIILQDALKKVMLADK
jgi:hypothetical protein